MLNKIASAILTPVSQAVIILLGLYTLVWGCWLAYPWTEVFTAAALYSQMATLLPEAAWGGIAIICGLGILWGALRPDYPTLTVSAAIAFGHWIMICIFYALGDPVNTGAITCLFLALLSGYLYLNTRLLHKGWRRKPVEPGPGMDK